MNTEQYLSQVKKINVRIDEKMDQLTKLRAFAEKTTPAFGDKVQTSKRDSFADNIAKIVDIEKEINDEITRLLYLREKITGEIDRMSDNVLSALLSARYLCDKTWKEIASELAYDERHILRLHARALKAFEKVNGKNH